MFFRDIFHILKIWDPFGTLVSEPFGTLVSEPLGPFWDPFGRLCLGALWAPLSRSLPKFDFTQVAIIEKTFFSSRFFFKVEVEMLLLGLERAELRYAAPGGPPEK